jgi:hypothetical protein
MKFSVEITGRGADLERVSAIYLSPEFGEAIAKAANLVERRQIRHERLPDGTEHTRTHVVPNVGLPAPVVKLLEGKVIAYDELVTYDPKTQTADFSIRSLAGKAVQVNGKVRFLADDKVVRLRFEGDARIHIFGLGGMLERFLVKEVTERYAQAEKVLQSFIDRGA